MASNSTMDSVAKFMELVHYFYITPVKPNRNPYVTFEIRWSKKHMVTIVLSIEVLLIMILTYAIELLVNGKSMDKESIVLILCLISMALVILGPLVWALCNLESLISLCNTFFRFNQYLGKFNLN